MQTRNKIFDDISQMMTNAMGVAQGAKTEAETAMKGMLDRWLADRDFVTREEFDAGPRRERSPEIAARCDGKQGITPCADLSAFVINVTHTRPSGGCLCFGLAILS